MSRLTDKGFIARAPQTAASVPELPDFNAELAALPGGQETNASLQRWWDVIRQRIEFNNGSVDSRISQITANFDNGVNTLQAQITHEEEVRADADSALATEIDTVSASVDGVIASVSILSSALATATGYLESRWTVNVTAGPIVTGMTLFSSSGPDTDVSYIAFQADRFQVNTASGGNKQIFSATATEIKLGSVLTVDLANTKLYVGTGTYANANTYFYVDTTSGGRMSLGDKFVWDGSALTVIGTITISNPTSFGVNYAGAASPGAAATSIVSQGALATLNSASWATQVSSRPTELTDGRITTAISAAGLVISGVTPGINVTTGSAGLYLGADFMGYYNGSAWKTYMDNVGNFYLGGTSGSLQWNGTTLTIVGGGTFSGALSAASGTFAGSLSAATGTFAGSLSAATGSFSGSITSTSGTIGGWSIGSTTLTGGNATLDSAGEMILGTSNDVVYLSASNASYRLWVGNVTAGSAAFSVTKAGLLYATGATISGTITSTSGTIGGFTIGALSISAGSGTSRIELNSTGSLSLGDISGIHGSYTYAGIGINVGAVPAVFLGTDGSHSGRLKLYDSSGVLNIYADAQSGDIAALSFTGNGGNITSLDASNIGSGTLNNARLPSAISVTTLDCSGTMTAGLIGGASGGYSVGIDDGGVSGSLKLKYDSGLDLTIIRVGSTDFINVRAGAYTGSTVTHDGFVEMKSTDGTTRKFMVGT